MAEQAGAGSIVPREHRCVANTMAMRILDLVKFAVSKFVFPDFLARLPAPVPWLYFQALHFMKPLRAYFFYCSRSREGRIASGFRWMLDAHVQNAISLIFSDIPSEYITTFFWWCRHSVGLFNICATTCVVTWLTVSQGWALQLGGQQTYWTESNERFTQKTFTQKICKLRENIYIYI